MLFFGASVTGPVRANNQDAFFAQEFSCGAFAAAVCDGMGGAAAGNLASETAASVIKDEITEALAKAPEKSFDFFGLLKNAVHHADDAIFALMSADSGLSGMGTTSVIILAYDGKAYIANIGDSRCYSFAQGNLTRLTKDHSYVQMLIDNGTITDEEAETHPQKNIITRSLGGSVRTEPEFFGADASCVFLLCSDGLTNYISELRIMEILSVYQSPQKAVNKMIAEAVKNGGGDNITCVIADFTEEI